MIILGFLVLSWQGNQIPKLLLRIETSMKLYLLIYLLEIVF